MTETKDAQARGIGGEGDLEVVQVLKSVEFPSYGGEQQKKKGNSSKLEGRGIPGEKNPGNPWNKRKLVGFGEENGNLPRYDSSGDSVEKEGSQNR